MFQISVTLVEIHFPLFLGGIMMHLLYHLVDELDICGLVTKWMYPIERYMKSLKLYVCNIKRLKASMTKGYI